MITILWFYSWWEEGEFGYSLEHSEFEINVECLSRDVQLKKSRSETKMVVTGLPGSPMAKNLSAHAGRATPGLERPNMPQSNQACVPQLLSLCSRAHEQQLLKLVGLEPVIHKRRHCNEKPRHPD